MPFEARRGEHFRFQPTIRIGHLAAYFDGARGRVNGVATGDHFTDKLFVRQRRNDQLKH